jgi:hypothetical protein
MRTYADVCGRMRTYADAWDMDVQVNMRTLDGPVKSVCISLDGRCVSICTFVLVKQVK